MGTFAKLSAIHRFLKNLNVERTEKLSVANGDGIHTYGHRPVILGLVISSEFRLAFTVAYLPYAVVGMNFIQHFSLLVDAGRRRTVGRNN